jgi:tetratricopeptide (TPR) repeat protein
MRHGLHVFAIWRHFLSWFFVAVLLGLSPAAAQRPPIYGICAGRDTALDEKIAACSTIIQSGHDSGTNLAVSYFNRGTAYGKKGDPDHAIADFDRAILAEPKYVNAYNNRSIAYRNKGNFDRAISDATEAINLDQSYAPAWGTRGTAYELKGDLDRAIADLDEAIKLDPQLAAAYNSRSVTYLHKNELDRALADVNQAIQLDPTFASAYNNRGWTYRRLGMLDRALQDANTAVRLNPKLALAFGTRGYVWLDKGELDRARHDFNEAIRLDPNRPTSYLGRGLVSERATESERARADYMAALTIPAKNKIDSTAQDTARERLAALKSKLEAPPPPRPEIIPPTNPRPVSPPIAEVDETRLFRMEHVGGQSETPPPPARRPLGDALAACSHSAPAGKKLLMVPGPNSKDIPLPDCYRGASDLNCRIKAITEEARTIEQDYSAIATAGYRTISDVQAICRLDLNLIKSHLKQSNQLDDKVTPLKNAFQSEATCIDEVRTHLMDMKVDVNDSNALKQSVVAYLNEIVQNAGVKQLAISDLIQKIKASQDAMHGLAEIRESVCE